jgi:hypothetical protein
MGGGLRRPSGPFQVICVLVAVALAVAFSISPLNVQCEQCDVRFHSGVDLDIARSIETGGIHDKIVDTARLPDDELRLPPLASGRDV